MVESETRKKHTSSVDDDDDDDDDYERVYFNVA